MIETNNTTPIRLSVYRDGRLWIGDLCFADGMVWKAWQVNRSFKRLVESARCTFDGEITCLASREPVTLQISR